MGKTDPNHLVISYLTIRKSIGILGIALPFVLVVGTVAAGACQEILPSVSSYYHSNTRNIFVGILSAVSLFLFCYKGYDNKDKITSKLASLFALGIAFFPTSLELAVPPCTHPPVGNNSLISDIHLFSAAAFFLTLSYISLFLFTKTNTAHPTSEKKKRNVVYKTCGWAMLSGLSLIFIYFVFIPGEGVESLAKYKPVFFLEAVCLVAFGTSWLTKGEAIFQDKAEPVEEPVLEDTR